MFGFLDNSIAFHLVAINYVLFPIAQLTIIEGNQNDKIVLTTE